MHSITLHIMQFQTSNKCIEIRSPVIRLNCFDLYDLPCLPGSLSIVLPSSGGHCPAVSDLDFRFA